MNLKDMLKLANSKEGKNVITKVTNAATALRGFAETYLGIYNEKGEIVQKGDRDYYFEYFEQILAELKEIKELLKNLENKT